MEPARAALVVFIGWASGISLYLTIALIGIGGRVGLIPLEGRLDILSHHIVIAIAVTLFVVEFLADKIPFVDSMWDAAHLAIKPLGAFAVAVLASSEYAAAAQAIYAIASGAIALDVHSMKAAGRLAINSSPEPFSNIAASLAEQTALVIVFWLCITHPGIALAVMGLTLIGSFFFLRGLFRLIRGVTVRPARP